MTKLTIPWLHRFAFFLSCLTVLLLAAGALVTGTGSGLAVPDWPLSFGQFFPPMFGGVLFEHGHRIIAGTVGIFTVCLAFVFWLSEPRPGVRALAIAAVGIVFCQAALGGLTVIFRLPTVVSVSHACLAQIFFSITVVLALVTSSTWKKPTVLLATEENALLPLPALCVLVNIVFFLQLIAGALMRHTHSGLAIPDFPLAFGHLVPRVFTLPIAIHFAHRLGAILVVTLVTWLTIRIYTRQSHQLDLVANAGALVGLVLFQLMLGAFIIWLRRPIPITTIHLIVGALSLASSVALTAQVFRLAGWRPFSSWGLSATFTSVSDNTAVKGVT